MFESILTGTMTDMASIEYQRQDVFQPTRKLQAGQSYCSLRGFSVAAISTTSAFEVLKFSQNFSPLGSVGFCLRLGPPATSPEARHHCTSQPEKAQSRLCSGFWRPRLPWMRRIKRAVASDQRFGEGKPPEA